jgi:hypothetical protein
MGLSRAHKRADPEPDRSLGKAFANPALTLPAGLYEFGGPHLTNKGAARTGKVASNTPARRPDLSRSIWKPTTNSIQAIDQRLPALSRLC